MNLYILLEAHRLSAIRLCLLPIQVAPVLWLDKYYERYSSRSSLSAAALRLALGGRCFLGWLNKDSGSVKAGCREGVRGVSYSFKVDIKIKLS